MYNTDWLIVDFFGWLSCLLSPAAMMGLLGTTGHIILTQADQLSVTGNKYGHTLSKPAGTRTWGLPIPSVALYFYCALYPV